MNDEVGVCIFWGFFVVLFSVGSYTTFHLYIWLLDALPLIKPPLSWDFFGSSFWGSYSLFMGRLLALAVSAFGGLCCFGCSLLFIAKVFWDDK